MPLFYASDKYKGITQIDTKDEEWGNSYGSAGYYISAKELVIFFSSLRKWKNFI
ncbi:MAG: hypothetical protein IPJ81_00305 [Chitinophagaceae bacterium]|nr:hypothetical protein [Chitinophagaceae bacterium]